MDLHVFIRRGPGWICVLWGLGPAWLDHARLIHARPWRDRSGQTIPPREVARRQLHAAVRGIPIDRVIHHRPARRAPAEVSPCV